MPSADLVRWTENALELHIRPLWNEAVRVANRANSADGPEKSVSLERLWKAFHRFTDELQVVTEAQAGALPDEEAIANARAESNLLIKRRLLLRDHPFTNLELAQLLSFDALWEAALKDLLRTLWHQEQRIKTLAVGGDRRFLKRAAALKSIAAHHFLSWEWSAEVERLRRFNQQWLADMRTNDEELQSRERKSLLKERDQYSTILARVPRES